MYVDLNELTIQRECLCSAKKGPFSFLSSLSHPLCILVGPSPFSPRQQPFAYPPITHRLKDHTEWSQRRPPLRLPPLASVSCLWRNRRVVTSPTISLHPFLFFVSSVFHNQCCCFFNMWGQEGFWWFICLFLFLIWERRCVRATFPHLSLTKHISWRPVLPLAPFCLSQPSSPFPSCPICLCLCAQCEPLSLLITITVHPLYPKLVNQLNLSVCSRKSM